MDGHVRGGSVVIGASQLGDDNRQWIEVIPTATEARNGPWFFTITPDDLQAYAESISANAGRIPVDYDHLGARDGGSTKAAGWLTGQTRVTETDDRGPILWAEVQWTPKAAQAIRDGEYRMISPEFTFKERDKKTGLMTKAKAIVAATLTNRPFFKELAAVASDDADECVELLETLAARLDDPERYTPEQRSAIQTKIRAAIEKIGADVTATTEGDDMEKAVVAAALGLGENATDEEIETALAAAKATGDELAAAKQELEDLKAAAASGDDRIKALEDERRAEKVEAALAKAVTDNRIDPAQKPVLAEQFAENFDGLVKLLETFPVRARKASGGGGTGADGVEPELAPVTIAGSEYDVNEDSARIDAKAREILTAAGKATSYTANEYLAACEEATKQLTAA